MADPLDMSGLRGLDPACTTHCTIEASITTGFEPTLAEELMEKMGLTSNISRGRVVFDCPVGRVEEVLLLRCVSTVYLLLGHQAGYLYQGSQDQQMVDLMSFVEKQLVWSKAMHVWAKVMGFKGQLFPNQNNAMDQDNAMDQNNAMDQDNAMENPSIVTGHPLSFRGTCYRSGEKSKHDFDSPLVARTVGGHVQDLFGWEVKMKGYDLEFVINCDPGQLYCALTLNHSSLGNRTITEFGLCTLRPTISACLARIAKLQPGDIVVDPMAGTGSIPLEGALGFPHTYHVAGELVKKGVKSCKVNLDSVMVKEGLRAQPAMDVLQWDAIKNPCLRDGSVDVILSDLPFGRRSGSKSDNRKLYPDLLLSMARLVRPDTGRAVLLTQDKTSMFMSLKRVDRFWTSSKPIVTNIGGLTALVFVLVRTCLKP